MNVCHMGCVLNVRRMGCVLNVCRMGCVMCVCHSLHHEPSHQLPCLHFLRYPRPQGTPHHEQPCHAANEPHILATGIQVRSLAPLNVPAPQPGVCVHTEAYVFCTLSGILQAFGYILTCTHTHTHQCTRAHTHNTCTHEQHTGISRKPQQELGPTYHAPGGLCRSGSMQAAGKKKVRGQVVAGAKGAQHRLRSHKCMSKLREQLTIARADLIGGAFEWSGGG